MRRTVSSLQAACQQTQSGDNVETMMMTVTMRLQTVSQTTGCNDMGNARNSPDTLGPANQAGKPTDALHIVGITVAINVMHTQPAPFLDGANLMAKCQSAPLVVLPRQRQMEDNSHTCAEHRCGGWSAAARRR